MIYDFEIVAGDSLVITIPVFDSADQPLDISAASGITWTLTSGGEPLLAKTLGSGINLLPGNTSFAVNIGKGEVVDPGACAPIAYHTAKVEIGDQRWTVRRGAVLILPA